MRPLLLLPLLLASSPEPPSRDAALGSARRQLAEGPGLPTQALSEATTRFPDDLELLELQAAVLEAQGDVETAARVHARLATLHEGDAERKPSAAPPPPRPLETTPGATMFVAATRLRVRAKPDDRSQVLGYLPINSQVKLLAIAEPWARISATVVPGLEHLEVDASSSRPLGKAVNPRKVEGHVRADLLSPDALTVEALLAEAAAFEAERRWHDAVRVLERAATLAFPPPELLNRLCRAAVEIGEYGTAAHWRALDEVAVQDGPAYARVLTRTVAGCRADRPRTAPDACHVGIRPCGYCAEKLRLLEGLTGRNRDETVLQLQAALEQHRRLVEAFAPFTPSRYLVVEVSVPSRPMNAGRLHVFHAPYSECGQAYRPRLVGRGLSWPPPGTTRVSWVKLPEVDGDLEGGLVRANSASVAMKLVKDWRAASCAGQAGGGAVLSSFEATCDCPFERGWQPGPNYEVCDEPGCN